MIPRRASIEARGADVERSCWAWAEQIQADDPARMLAELDDVPKAEACLRALILGHVIESRPILAALIRGLCLQAADPANGCGADLQGDAARCRRALLLAREARDLLRSAGASRSYDRARGLVASIGGAVRHAEGKDVRRRCQDPPA